MECKNCKYYDVSNVKSNGKSYTTCSCDITHRVNSKSCGYITSDEDVESMDICYNCKHWIGGGDWGLSCQKNYYKCNANGFEKACEQFEKKM